MSSHPALQLESVHKTFGTRTVLRGVSLTIARGEIIAIVGRSGCGKSTLLRLVAGLDTPGTGSIQICGELLKGCSERARLMFQDAALLPWRTALQNVALTLSAALGNTGEKARAALAHVGLADRADEWPSRLSGGQRQRVALARALAGGADLLLLDEPLGALDALTRLEMQDLIERLWQEERFGVLLITHDAEEAVALADRVFVMEDGVLAHSLQIDLPRPRARGDRAFVALKEQVIERVLARHTAA